MEHLQYDEISLREMLEVIIKGKYIIAFMMILCIIIGSVGPFLVNPYVGKAKTIIALSFQGIEQGLNPDGTKFNIYDLNSPVVLQKALESLSFQNKKLTTDYMRNNLQIQPIIPDGISDKIEAMRKAGSDYIYYPNQYVLTYTIGKNEGLTQEQGRQILEAIVDAYYIFFIDIYSGTRVLESAMGSIDYDTYDYPEVSIVMRNQLSIMNSFLQQKSIEAGTFRAKSTGFIFGDIKNSIDVIDTVELSRMDSIIGANNLTKDKQKLIVKYEYAIKRLELNRSKKEDEAKIAKDMMDVFKREQNTLLLPSLSGGVEGQNGMIQAQESVSYYDKLAEQSVQAAVNSKDSVHDMEYFTQEIERLRNDIVPQDLKKKAEEDVAKLIDSIKTKLETWISITNRTLEEYLEYKYSNAIVKVSPVEVKTGINIKLNVAIGAVLGLMVGVFIAFFKEYWKNTRSTNKSVVTK